MFDTLHILNGDSTLAKFKQTELTGDTYVWHEILCQGPVQEDITTESFWRARSNFMSSYVDITEDSFQEKVILPFQQLEETLDSYQEIVLWFEYDLFCHINMIAAISLLKQKKCHAAERQRN